MTINTSSIHNSNRHEDDQVAFDMKNLFSQVITANTISTANGSGTTSVNNKCITMLGTMATIEEAEGDSTHEITTNMAPVDSTTPGGVN